MEPCEFATLDRTGTFFAFTAGSGAERSGGSHSALSEVFAAAARGTPGMFASRGTVAAPAW